MGRAGLGKRGHPGAGVGTGEAVRAGERDRKRAWEEAEGRVGVRPAAPRSLGAAHGSPGMDDPTLANPQSMGLEWDGDFSSGKPSCPGLSLSTLSNDSLLSENRATRQEYPLPPVFLIP